MSHIVQIRTQIKDEVALGLACRRLALPELEWRTIRLFSSEATGHVVQLPDWRYPVVCNVTTGQIQYDNYGGRWGDEAQLHRFLQMYAVEKTKLEARKVGQTATEQTLADGSICVQIVAA
ncbi:MAG TPA: DUF1257 domain-containing protein [Planctomycetaceae bacterium]|nr:DUF1257 domain-containing protein [Planctomycetaceae bacterium]